MEKLICVIIIVTFFVVYLSYIFLRDKIWKDITSSRGLRQYSVWQILWVIDVIRSNRNYFFRTKNPEVSEVEKEVFKKIFEALLEKSIKYIETSKDFSHVADRFIELQSWFLEKEKNDYVANFFSNEIGFNGILIKSLLQNKELIVGYANEFLKKYGREEFERFWSSSELFKFSQKNYLLKFEFSRFAQNNRYLKEA